MTIAESDTTCKRKKELPLLCTKTKTMTCEIAAIDHMFWFNDNIIRWFYCIINQLFTVLCFFIAEHVKGQELKMIQIKNKVLLEKWSFTAYWFCTAVYTCSKIYLVNTGIILIFAYHCVNTSYKTTVNVLSLILSCSWRFKTSPFRIFRDPNFNRH